MKPRLVLLFPLLAACSSVQQSGAQNIELRGRLSNYSEVSGNEVELDQAVLLLDRTTQPIASLKPNDSRVVFLYLPEELHVTWDRYRGHVATVRCGDYWRIPTGEVKFGCGVRSIQLAD